MRAVSYERVSSEEQVTNYSLDAQHDVNLNVMDSKGWPHVGTYRDEGVSAQTTDRPSFKRMIADARMGLFDVIVVHKLDRFSRSLTDMMLTMRTLEGMGVTVISATEQFDFTTPIGRVLLALIAAIAEWFIDNLRIEVQKGKKKRALSGGWSNRLSFGYYAQYKKYGGDGFAVPDEHDSNGVRLMFNLYQKGTYSFDGVAEALKRAGYKPTQRGGQDGPGNWNRDAVAFALKNRFYIGEVMYQGRWYPGVHEPIIDRDQFDRVQAIMKARRKLPGFTAKKSDRVYLLTGIARCGRCQNKMRGTYREHGGVETRYYRCSARLRNQECDMRLVRADEVEKTIESYLKRIRIPTNWREVALAHTRQQSRETITDTPKQSEGALKARLARLTELYEDGDITKQQYQKRKAQIEKELDDLIATKAGVGTMFNLDRAMEVLATMGNTWDAATPVERQQIVRALLSEVVIESADRITLQPRPEVSPLFDAFR